MDQFRAQIVCKGAERNTVAEILNSMDIQCGMFEGNQGVNMNHQRCIVPTENSVANLLDAQFLRGHAGNSTLSNGNKNFLVLGFVPRTSSGTKT